MRPRYTVKVLIADGQMKRCLPQGSALWPRDIVAFPESNPERGQTNLAVELPETRCFWSITKRLGTHHKSCELGPVAEFAIELPAKFIQCHPSLLVVTSALLVVTTTWNSYFYS